MAIENEPAPQTAFIREYSRDRLNRLNELYANPQNLSSPVHRTEPGFTLEEDSDVKSGVKLKPRTNKLNELIQSRNEWVDEAKKKASDAKKLEERNQTDGMPWSPAKSRAISKLGGPSPRKYGDGTMTKTNASPTQNASNKKTTQSNQVTFQKDYMDSLEMQGFKRRDTTHKRLEYNFNDYAERFGEKKNNREAVPSKATPAAPIQKTVATASSAERGGWKKPASAEVPKKAEVKPPPAKKNEIGKNLVSDRAAIFESQQSRSAHASAAKSNNKDPTELSLRERMALFEKNQGTALIPKAPLGIAPSLKQIMGDQKPSNAPKPVITSPQQPIITSNTMTTSQISQISNYNRAPQAETMAGGSSIRQTVENLLSRKATISESKIANETRKNRAAEMNVVLNRLNLKPNETTDEEREMSPVRSSAPPPPAPPMPDHLLSTSGRKGKRTSSKYFVEVLFWPVPMRGVEAVLLSARFC